MSTQRFVYFFGAGQADGGGDLKHLVGGKGASLGDMTRAQLQVPPGFTISTECCDLYYRTGKHWPDGLAEEIRANLDRLQKQVGRPFGQGDNPLLVAVRSGAEQSMPGMMDTVLNVGLNPACVRALAAHGQARAAWDGYRHFLAMYGHTVAGIDDKVFHTELARLLREVDRKTDADLDAAQLEELCQRYTKAYREHAGHDVPAEPWDMLAAAINAVFGSWNSDRAIAYRQHHHIHGLLGTAVTVQMMCPSEVSGVLFTANPVNPTLEQVIIESSYGLGEAIVLGKVTPDRFVIDKNSGKILEREISAKDHVIATVTEFSREPQGSMERVASLTDAQIDELVRLGHRVEDYFQMPCDIEWGLAGGQFYLLQARAIKGLEDAKLIQQVRRDTVERLKRQVNGKPSAWVIYNLAETLPRPTPMTWDIMKRFMSGSGGYGRMYQDLGFQPSEQVKQDGFLDLICGRIFLDTRRHAQLFWGAAPFEYDLELIRQDPAQAEAMPTRFARDAGFFHLVTQSVGVAWKTGRLKKRVTRLKKDFDRQFETEILPPYLAYIRQKHGEDLTKYSDVELVRELESRLVRVLGDFAKEAVKLSYFGGEAYGELTARLQQLFERAPNGSTEATALASSLTAGLDNDKTVEANLKLMRIARGELTKEQFLEEFGHRASQEFELSQPRWREDPASFLDHTIDSFRAHLDADPGALHHKMKERRLEAERALPDRLKARHQGAAIAEITDLCDQVRRYLPYRETAKHYLLMGYELLRLVLLEIDRRMGLAGGVFYLHYQELPELMSGRNLAKEIAARREWRRAEQRVNVPDVIFSNDLDAIGRVVEVENQGDALQGTPIAPGSGSGPAAIVFDPAEAKNLTSGYVLVCPSTDPGWTPLFIRAAGLIMERGGVLSHGAVVARDLGIPAVVIKNATKSIVAGEGIRVDGNSGAAVRLRAGR